MDEEIFFNNNTLKINMNASDSYEIHWDFLNYSEYNDSFCEPPKSLFQSYILVWIYFLYALMFIVSVIGNGVVCYIVIATPRMRTVTNYFIANLAIGEMLITLMCVPFTSISIIQQYWPFYNILCPVSSMAQAVSVFVSAYTLVAISIDRYVAIMWPLQPRLSKKTTAFVIFAVWLCAIITALPLIIVTQAEQPARHYEICDMYMCKEDWTEFGQDYANVYTKTLLILQYVLPVSVLIFTYTSIGIVIWCHRIPGEAEDGRDLRIARSKRKMIKMMVAVVLVYTICWLPLNIYLVMREMGVDIVHEEIVWLASHLLAMSHPCYNPVIYCYMNNRFRQGFMQIFGIVLPCCRSACSRAAMMNNNGRSRMSIPLTSIGGTDSTILHRNNTCTTYISTRRRTGNSLVGGAGTNGTPNLRLHHRPTRIQFSETVNVNNPNGHTPAAVGGEETSQSNNYSTGMPPVRSLSVMSRQSANNSENESQHLITRKSSHKKEKNDKKAKNSYNFNDLSETEFHNCQKVNLLN